jgi:hypothetical protein
MTEDINPNPEGAMKKLLQKFEDIMVAVTFAEAGEYEMAKKLSGGVVKEEEDAPVQEGETETA